MLTEDILFSSQSVRIRRGKGKRQRIVRIRGACCQDLYNYLREFPRENNIPLFTSLKQNRPFEGATVRRIIYRVASRVNARLSVHPHLFRHSFAMNMLRRGAHLMAIKNQLGHADIETTMAYLRDDFGRTAAQYEMFAPCYS